MPDTSLLKKNEKLKGRCDSFVVETNVHYPTDINLLFDCMTTLISQTASIFSDLNRTHWRQSKYNIRQLKKLYRKAQCLKHSTSKNKEKKEKQKEKMIEAHNIYIQMADLVLLRVKKDLKRLENDDFSNKKNRVDKLFRFIKHADRQIDQIKRRVILGEVIPHEEKVFSVFECHSEWISKGKAGVLQELGLKVCVFDDQYGFVLNYRVMQAESDVDVTVPFTAETKALFPELFSGSFDKGFYSRSNREELEKILDEVTLPKKGKWSKKDKELETAQEFVAARKRHSGIESCINALENHGLDRVLDRGEDGFKKYVALAIVARNTQVLGNILQQKELKKLKRKRA